eukprot:gene5990-6597_t
MKWRLIEEERLASKVNLFWIDVAAINERFRTILPWQMINHFPGMPNIARKNRMGQNLNRMQRLFPKEYSFYPRTWVLPSELNEFRNQFDTNGNALNNRIFIIKPDAGCQGRGILLTRSLDQVPITENVVAQIYVKKPFLLDNYKFDLRIYLYITSIKPLRMYLFHDGLVRMCTEEYVKPTRSNLHQLCMHLTNYAVNKHNNNFTQPNSINIEDQENSSKRSLQWFMFYIAEKYGIEKANWLWKRIGVVCTRTVLSILPTLSREYDAHFRTFNNIPVDSKKIPRPGGVGGGGGKGGKVGGGGGGSSKKGSSSSSRGRSLGNNKSLNGNSSDSGGGEEEQEEEEEEGEEEQEEEEGQDEGGAGGGGSSSTEQGIDNYDKDGATSSSSSSSCSPQIRGSRCIEVLGFDIMIDDKLNPTLIEVNHLPSFGTDSALDLDVKERLMQQVFSVLPCLPDDAVAYGYQMKVEAERRQAEKMLAMENSRAQAQKVWRTEIIDEECTPERIEEIKRILREIYTIYSAEKINKIDRLLQKYVGHEEEFLRFVYAKYNVSPATYEKENVRTDSQVNHRNNAAEGMAKRISRSLSPPRTKKTPTSGAGGGGGGNGNVNGNSAVRRMSAAWKAPPDEEAQYRQDILREHVPEEEEEWMRYEMSKLTQFTRVFPPLPKEKEVDYITAVRLENPHLASQAGLSVGGGGDGGVGGGGGGFDPQECGGAGGGGFYPPPQDSATTLWPSTKANRLYEEARRNRLRVEAQRSQNGAVLRQQVFFFDPNYENNSMANLAAAAAAAMAMHHQQGLHPHPTNGPSPVMGHLGLPLSVGGGGGVVGGGGGGGHPDGLAALGRSSSSKLAANAAGLLFSTPSLSQQQQQQQAQLPPSSSSQVSYGHHINAGTLSQQQLQLQQNGAGGGGGGGGGGKQEELLKQLFPSWF